MESPSVFQKRAYRKELHCPGLIYFGGQERSIRVLNISLTGALAELDRANDFNNINALFQAMQASANVDIFVPEVCLAGGASIVRAEQTSSGYLIGIEFRDVLYNSPSQMRNRRSYRKPIQTEGHLTLDGKLRSFMTENASLDGIKIQIPGYLIIDPGATGILHCEALGLEGQVEVVWVTNDAEHTIVGLRFQSLTLDQFIGIPRFTQPLAMAA